MVEPVVVKEVFELPSLTERNILVKIPDRFHRNIFLWMHSIRPISYEYDVRTEKTSLKLGKSFPEHSIPFLVLYKGRVDAEDSFLNIRVRNLSENKNSMFSFLLSLAQG